MTVYLWKGKQLIFKEPEDLKRHLMPLVKGEVKPEHQLRILLEWKGRVTTDYLVGFWTMPPESIDEAAKTLNEYGCVESE